MRLRKKKEDGCRTLVFQKGGTELDVAFCGINKVVNVIINSKGDDWQSDMDTLLEGWNDMDWTILVIDPTEIEHSHNLN